MYSPNISLAKCCVKVPNMSFMAGVHQRTFKVETTSCSLYLLYINALSTINVKMVLDAGFIIYKFSDIICINCLKIYLCSVVKSNVICSESTMTVEVEKSEFFGDHENHFQLNDPSNTACRINSNRSHLFAVIPLNACGTQIEVTQGRSFHHPLFPFISSVRTEYKSF